MLGLEGEKKEKRKHVHGGDQIRNLTRKCLENITQDIKTELLELYKYEFALFNYDIEQY